MSTPITCMAVVVPARNEAALLPAALTALDAATRAFTAKNPGVTVSVTVALDSTTDNSRELLAQHRGVQTVTLEAGLVGTARNAGIVTAWARAQVPPEQLWIANTDADSEVPSHWLQRQYELAIAGAHMVVGTVEPGSLEAQGNLMQRWLARHEFREGHPHVHGANLGLRADVFTGLGGFKDQGLHEDRDLVRQARARGYKVLSTDSCRVKTSGRLQGRVNGGFADFLGALGRQVGAGPDKDHQNWGAPALGGRSTETLNAPTGTLLTRPPPVPAAGMGPAGKGATGDE